MSDIAGGTHTYSFNNRKGIWLGDQMDAFGGRERRVDDVSGLSQYLPLTLCHFDIDSVNIEASYRHCSTVVSRSKRGWIVWGETDGMDDYLILVLYLF